MNKVKFRTHIDSWMSFDCGREIHFSFKKRHGQRLGQPSRVTRFAFHLCPNSVCRQHPKRRCWGSWAMACCMEVWSSWGRGAAKPTRFGSTEWRKSPFFSICSSSQMMDQLAPTLPSGVEAFWGLTLYFMVMTIESRKIKKRMFFLLECSKLILGLVFLCFSIIFHFSNKKHSCNFLESSGEFLPPGCLLCAFTLHGLGCLLLPTAPPQTAQRRCSFR